MYEILLDLVRNGLFWASQLCFMAGTQMPASFPILRLVFSNWIKHIIKDYIHVSAVKTKVMQDLKRVSETVQNKKKS